MRRNKHKHTRRAVVFYKLNYGFHEPYKVLLDGNFIHAAISINLADLATHISKLLGAKIKLYVTRCVTWELQDLGEEFQQALKSARACELHKCGHNQGECTPATCILQQIGEQNADRWWVATQDATLRAKLQQVPGCPIIFATINGIHLQEPHEMDKSTAKQVTSTQQAIPEHERSAEALKDLELIRPQIKTSVKFRRKKAKGPNPLSVKKKKVTNTSTSDHHRQADKQAAGQKRSAESINQQQGEKKRKRRRHKSNSDGTASTAAPAAS